MTLSDIDTKVIQLTKCNTAEYPNANRLIDLNIWNQNVVTEILSSQDSSDFDDQNHSGYATLQTPLQENIRDYNFGINDGVVKIHRVDVSYDGVNVYQSTPLDSSEIAIGLEESTTDVDSYFSTNTPHHDWKYNSAFLYPKPTATTGFIEIEVSRTAKDFELSDYTTGTATPGFDRNFHQILPYGMAYEYFIGNGMQNDASRMDLKINNLLAKLRNQYGDKETNYPLRMQDNLENYN